MNDICIIGGGPAGMCAAISAKLQKPLLRVCILEKNQTLGKKIYATGNGKCNLSHISCPDPIDVLKFFDQVGIFTRVDDAGRMYPASEQAADVVLALQKALEAANVEVKHNNLPKSITKTEQGFEIELADETIHCKKLLIATGGKAGPQYGNLGEGYAYAKRFGHRVTRTFPVLAPLECEGEFRQLKGIRAKGLASLLNNGAIVATETGEIQFTEDGLSGICMFNLSRFVRMDPNLPHAEAMKAYTISIDFVPSMTLTEIETHIKKRAANPAVKVDDLLLTMVHPGISGDILKRAGIRLGNNAGRLTHKEIQQIADFLKHWESKVTGVKGWKKAQCTGGGIPLNEVDAKTRESILVDGLYFAGELLDYDGPSGGFNLHFAWESGIQAGKAMADEIV